ncbi:MAG TPA: sigma-70 family RNA polymerase sigma factor [Kofleriaceae bacterium]|nr:sigma-70 family RNA polymerase sigma factor [Kofleriaceae bacterium]
MNADPKTVTALLRDWRHGDRAALDQLVPIVYAELRKLAASFMRGERPGHTFRPTDLVSEAYLRLLGAAPSDLTDRAHFFAIAGRTMRQILVDHARWRTRDKRGGGERPITLDADVPATERPEALVALDDALVALEAFDARKAKIVELSYFGGLTQAEIATVLDVHVNTVARDLRLAEAWIHGRIRGTT